MRIVIAPNAFKGTLSALEAGRAIERGLKHAHPKLRTEIIPMADGGDGTLDAIINATGGTIHHVTARDPLERIIKARFGLIPATRTAVIELAEASGLVRLRPAERNPMKTSSTGTGDLIRAAVKLGARHLLLTLGGSATVDGGIGLAHALGVRFFDGEKRELAPNGANLQRIATMDLDEFTVLCRRITVEIACDVDNSLCGPRGAAAVFGPQKGATPAMVKRLDAGLRNLATILEKSPGVSVMDIPGAGAAGGAAAMLMALFNAKLSPGVDRVMKAIHLKDRIRGADWVITGEGRIDDQTAHGKAPAGVAKLAKRQGIPCIAICGSVGPGSEKLSSIGIQAIYPCVTKPKTEAQLRRGAARRLEATALRAAKGIISRRDH